MQLAIADNYGGVPEITVCLPLGVDGVFRGKNSPGDIKREFRRGVITTKLIGGAWTTYVPMMSYLAGCIGLRVLTGEFLRYTHAY